MKVFELIKKLEQFDQDDEVIVLWATFKDNGYSNIRNYQIIDVKNAAFGGRVVSLEVQEI